jgi:hypothetical protein
MPSAWLCVGWMLGVSCLSVFSSCSLLAGWLACLLACLPSPLLLTLLCFAVHLAAGFPQFAPGFVPSPQNPMPRLRRRKSVPERVSGPSVASPIKSLFTRRSSLAGGPTLMSSFGYPAAAAVAEEGSGGSGAGGAAGGVQQTPAEARLRHCLQQPRTQRWAAAEFCYSALDRPFFMFNPLSGLLAQLGLGEDARLTRKEWALIRSGLGEWGGQACCWCVV